MKFEELPEELQKHVVDLKFCSQTIQSDVLDSLESAENLGEFRFNVENSMNNIIGEAQRVCEVLGTIKERCGWH